MSRTLLSLSFLLTCLTIAAPGHAESFRYSLASQQEFSAKRGFKLYFEDNDTSQPRKLETLRLFLGVADGDTWRFPDTKTLWQWDHDYQVKAVITQDSADFWLDGQPVIHSAGAFLPARDQDVLKAGLDSRNLLGTTEYLIQQNSLRINTSRAQSRDFVFPKPETRPLSLFAFEPQTPIVAPFKMAQGESLTIETSFRILHAPDLKALSPFVDRYGQSRQAEWPSKIHNDGELKQTLATEQQHEAAWGTPAGYDAYGGSTTAGWSEKATGFFATTRRNGVWWLLSPFGNPCFYIGVDTVLGTFEKTGVSGREFLFDELPPADSEFRAAWGGNANNRSFGFTVANLIRKYGTDWGNAAWQQAGTRLKSWGFSGVGKWSGLAAQIQVPAQPVLRRDGVPTLGRMPDVFDDKVRVALHAALEKSITPQKNNPYVIGWSLNNEHDEIVLKSDIQSILKMPATVAAKGALIDYALNHIYGGDGAKMMAAWKINGGALADAATLRANLLAAMPQPPDEDIETLRRYFADQYYDFIYRTVKELDPNHLYFGFWIAVGWWENEEDWRLIARHCDVIGYDAYEFNFADARMDRLMKEADKPVLCGEFSFPSWYQGQRGLGAYGTATASDAEAGQRYASWLQQAAHNPYCLGVDWFQYRDQPLTGRDNKGNGLVLGEHYAFGLVDIADQPKWDMIAPMRQANLAAVGWRLGAMGKGP